jgi:uncharacterized protein YcbK (DUF882 family)
LPAASQTRSPTQVKIENCADGDYTGALIVLRAHVAFAAHKQRGGRKSNLTAARFGKRSPGDRKGIFCLGFVSLISASAGRRSALARLLAAPMLLGFAVSPSSTESAVANGDTRTIVLTSDHTKETGSFTYMVDGAYDQATLDKLNWFLRDWRLNEPTKMDPKLFDIVWEVYRESGSKQPIDVLSGYRSPQTNAMLRRRSRQVAKYSQHMEGKAMDARFQDVDTATIRDIAMRMQAGGVGFYPGAWVHIDSGDVRYWPRMSRVALAQLFPDGKTVFIPADGQPMTGYEQARAEIEARGGEVQVANADAGSSAGGGGLLSWLFGARGGGSDDEEDSSAAEAAPNPRGGRAAAPAPAQVASADAPAPQPSPAAAETDAGAADVGPADAADADFDAPLPPLKPLELALADGPTPPARPTDLGFLSATDTSGDRDLVAALLARGGAPSVITRGVGAPRGILALTETGAPEPSERPAILDRAAALNAPLPPVRPARVAAKTAVSETSVATPDKAAAKAPTPFPTARGVALLSPAEFGSLISPYGDLVTDGFNPGPDAPNLAATTAELHGSTP